ncbi:unnamed protein product [Nezara viridula]|uniref:C2 domain-containing protein n=1 Tax=Nezara viridula TaxID=85310 RepID=A0A9P0ED22_NEZVI|nr:unnamed protein product [Nezara viridula]
MIAESQSFIYNGDATSAVVGMGSGCILILIVLAVYFHKKLCFQYGVHLNLPCCDKSLRPSSSLGEAFKVAEAESSSDSDEEVINKLHKSMTLHSTTTTHPPHFNIRTHLEGENEHEERSSASSCCSSTSMDEGIRNREKKLKKNDNQQENQNDCIVIMGQEPAFDLSDVKRGGHGDGSGALQVSLAYDAPTRKLTLHLLQATDMPSPPTNLQVRVVLLPNKKQRYKSKCRQGENPQFMESFLFHRISPEDISKLGVRLRVYAWERLRRQRLLGEATLSLVQVNLDLESNLWLTMDPSVHTFTNTWCGDVVSLGQSDSTGSSVSLHQGVAELLLGLAYSGTTGRLTVEIIKGSHFRDATLNRAPDTYVKLSLVSSTGQEMTRSKTSIRRAQPNPLFKETFMFQVALFQLADVTLMVSVFCKRPMKRKEMLGWFCLGQNSSGVEELSHWQDMCQIKGEQICRWHVLIEK